MVEDFHDVTQLNTVGDPLIQHPEISAVKFYYDPVEPLAKDEWVGINCKHTLVF